MYIHTHKHTLRGMGKSRAETVRLKNLFHIPVRFPPLPNGGQFFFEQLVSSCNCGTSHQQQQQPHHHLISGPSNLELTHTPDYHHRWFRTHRKSWPPWRRRLMHLAEGLSTGTAGTPLARVWGQISTTVCWAHQLGSARESTLPYFKMWSEMILLKTVDDIYSFCHGGRERLLRWNLFSWCIDTGEGSDGQCCQTGL